MSKVELIQEDPPGDGRHGRQGRGAVSQWLVALRQHPNVWFKYPEPISPSQGSKIRHGEVRGVTEGEFETRCKIIPGNGPARAWLYVMFVGEPA